MPNVLITPASMQTTPSPFGDLLENAGFQVKYPSVPNLPLGLASEESTIQQLEGMDAIIAGGEFLTSPVMEALSNLRVIARAGVGFDRVNIEAATRQGIVVTVTPTANHEAVAEHAITLLLVTVRSILPNVRQVCNGEWPRGPLATVRGKTLGIIGLGRIGRSTAIRAIPLGLKIVAHEIYPDQEFVQKHCIELLDFDELLEKADFVSIHCPLTEQTHHLFNKKSFARMKPQSILINTARGPLVKESDLLEALLSGHLKAAGLDVLEQEPPSSDNPLLQMENVIITPHLAGGDEVSVIDMGMEAAHCIISLHRGHWPSEAVINHELKSNWKW